MGKQTYKLIKTNLGNRLDLEVETEEYCVYCRSCREPNFRDPEYPMGSAECGNPESEYSIVNLDDTCDLWENNDKVRFWLSKGYMQNNLEGWPKNPWYRLFDDGPDGKKGTR